MNKWCCEDRAPGVNQELNQISPKCWPNSDSRSSAHHGERIRLRRHLHVCGSWVRRSEQLQAQARLPGLVYAKHGTACSSWPDQDVVGALRATMPNTGMYACCTLGCSVDRRARITTKPAATLRGIRCIHRLWATRSRQAVDKSTPSVVARSVCTCRTPHRQHHVGNHAPTARTRHVRARLPEGRRVSRLPVGACSRRHAGVRWGIRPPPRARGGECVTTARRCTRLIHVLRRPVGSVIGTTEGTARLPGLVYAHDE